MTLFKRWEHALNEGPQQYVHSTRASKALGLSIYRVRFQFWVRFSVFLVRNRFFYQSPESTNVNQSDPTLHFVGAK